MNEPKAPQTIPSGPERELQIYAQALSGGKLPVPISLCVLEQKAKEILQPRAYDYVAGGAGGEDTMRANREAFYRWRIVPRMLRDVSKRDLSVELPHARSPCPPRHEQFPARRPAPAAPARATARQATPRSSRASKRPAASAARSATGRTLRGWHASCLRRPPRPRHSRTLAAQGLPSPSAPANPAARERTVFLRRARARKSAARAPVPSASLAAVSNRS